MRGQVGDATVWGQTVLIFPDGLYAVPFRKATSRELSASSSTVSHSHMIMTLQPSSRRAFRFAQSRSTFLWNLSRQNDVRVMGVVVRRHPSCRCQKQPWTKITFLRPGKQMSGVPGRVRRCSRKRYPRRWRSCLTVSSGKVFAEPMRAMFALRSGEGGGSGFPGGRVLAVRSDMGGFTRRPS